jgi:hypothetical protein
MKRRKFIKGLLLAPAVLKFGALLPEKTISGGINKVVIDGREFNVNPLDNWADFHGTIRHENENDSDLRERLLFMITKH